MLTDLRRCFRNLLLIRKVGDFIIGPRGANQVFKFFGRRKRKSLDQDASLARDFTWVKPDESWLPGTNYTARPHEVLHGPVAEFHPDGQLWRLSHYFDDVISSAHHQLELELGRPTGTVRSDGVVCRFKDGIEEVEFFFEGERDYIRENAHWEEWVRKWIHQITAGKSVLLYFPDESVNQSAV